MFDYWHTCNRKSLADWHEIPTRAWCDHRNHEHHPLFWTDYRSFSGSYHRCDYFCEDGTIGNRHYFWSAIYRREHFIAINRGQKPSYSPGIHHFGSINWRRGRRGGRIDFGSTCIRCAEGYFNSSYCSFHQTLTTVFLLHIIETY